EREATVTADRERVASREHAIASAGVDPERAIRLIVGPFRSADPPGAPAIEAQEARSIEAHADKDHAVSPTSPSGGEALPIALAGKPLATTDGDGIAALDRGPGFAKRRDEHHV